MIHDMASVCDSFGDLLPIKKVTTGEAISEHAETGFMFTGSKTNPSRLDELALSLLKILRNGIIYETKHATTPYCKLLSLCKTICLYSCALPLYFT